MSNPVLGRYANFSGGRRGGGVASWGRDAFHEMNDSGAMLRGQMSNRGGGRLTLDDVLMKTLVLFAVLVPVALAAAFFTPPALQGTVMLVSLVALIVLGIATMVKKTVSPAFVFLYVTVKGVFAGVLSAMYAYLFDGAVTTALIATVVAAVTVIAGVKVGILRTSPRARKIFGFLLLGYFAFSIIAVVAALAGFPILTFGSGFLVLVSVFGVGMAVFSFVTDVEDVQAAVQAGVPESESWRLAFGVAVSLVWLYLEILRLVGALQSFSD